MEPTLPVLVVGPEAATPALLDLLRAQGLEGSQAGRPRGEAVGYRLSR